MDPKVGSSKCHLLVAKRTILANSLATHTYIFFHSNCTKNGVFFSAASCKNAPLLVQVKKFFGPFNFLMVLGRNFSSQKRYELKAVDQDSSFSN